MTTDPVQARLKDIERWNSDYQAGVLYHPVSTDSIAWLCQQVRTLLARVVELERVEVCPNDQTVAHFKCDKCGEEWYDHRQGMAHTNQRLAPKVRELEADLTAARQQLAAAQERIEKLEAGLRPFMGFLVVLEAHQQVAELPPLKDSDNVAYFMGSGASARIDVGELRAARHALLQRLAPAEGDNDGSAWCCVECGTTVTGPRTPSPCPKCGGGMEREAPEARRAGADGVQGSRGLDASARVPETTSASPAAPAVDETLEGLLHQHRHAYSATELSGIEQAIRDHVARQRREG